MIFLVDIEVTIPRDADPAEVERLQAAERERALELQRRGTWRHLWRVVGRYRSVSVFDAASHAELHELISDLPLRPFMDVSVTPLTAHPSALEGEGGDAG